MGLLHETLLPNVLLILTSRNDLLIRYDEIDKG